MTMTFREKLLYHQIHPFKLTIDAVSTFASLILYWKHYFLPGLATAFILPLVASAATLAFFNVEYLKTSSLGTYAQKHMTARMYSIRLATNFILLSGAWYHLVIVVIAGILIIIGCWCWGIILDWFAR